LANDERSFVNRVVRITVVVWALSLGAECGFAGDSWPQFRGPSGQGHSDSVGLPISWSEKENIAWKVPVPGRGWSSPVVLGGQIWLTTALDGGHSLRALCFELQSGKLLRDVEVFHPAEPAPLNDKNSHASPTPVIEGRKLWVHFGSMGTACIDTASGEVLWRNTEHETDHKEGPGSSPALDGDLLLLNFDGRDQRFVVALNKDSGKLVWKKDRSAPRQPSSELHKAYSTPLVIRSDGRDLAISPGGMRVSAYDVLSGEEIWSVDYPGFSTVPRPVAGHGMVFISTGYLRPEIWAIRLGGKGNVSRTHVAWKYSRQAPANPSPLLVGKELYFVSDGGVATCLDALSGKERWTQRLGGNFSASPLAADGRIYFFNEAGQSTVVAPETIFRRLAVNQLKGTQMATPAVVGKAFVVRTDTHLYRIEK
jgi:outer membrane protein assembly factor BamB